jgi:oxygen-independent coproporphyrinogen III oxidase
MTNDYNSQPHNSQPHDVQPHNVQPHNVQANISQEVNLLTWNPHIIQRYDMAGPRYTSYPTAPQFRDSFSDLDLRNAIARSNAKAKPLSLYFHIPFCESLCYYCGCNKIVTPNKERAAPYLKRMIQELAMQATLFDTTRVVKQLHWGGGTPTYISDTEMTQLMVATRQHFNMVRDDSGEYSIEIHPGKVTLNTMQHLRRLGFNRVSMGIQDFDEKVQHAVNRYNTYDEVAALVAGLRAAHYHSISMDLIYGLPHQTELSFAQTLNKIIELSPDRISLFNYAHMPHLFKSQQLINAVDLPSAEEKLELLYGAIARLQAAGYIYIGMDHFAKPEDDLVKAQMAGQLQRNFQGYSTHGDCDLLAFGVSAISAIDNIYVQNEKTIIAYQEKLDKGFLPTTKGFTLSQADELRKYIINQLICHFVLSFQAVQEKFNINMQTYFANELQTLKPMVEDGLVTICYEGDAAGIYVQNTGRMLIRRICMVFDEYLQASNTIRYSKII